VKAEAIRVGDHFKMPSGSVWKVLRVLPSGRVELFNKAESRFVNYYTRQVRKFERLPSQLSESQS